VFEASAATASSCRPTAGESAVPLFAVPLFSMFGLGPMELLIVAGVVLLLFGSRLPKVMRSLGEGIVEFKRGVQGIEDTGATPRDTGHSDVR
jgi:sec-independent protein translocase protein TatA